MEYFFIFHASIPKEEIRLDSGRGFRPLNLKLQEYQVNYRYIFEGLELC